MSKEVVSYMLSGMDNMKSLQVQLILQCAPFLKGIKVSCILNISKENEEELLEVLKGTGIRFKVLTRNQEKSLVFLYRRKSFSEYLKRADVYEFLNAYGYESSEPEAMLEHLSERVCQYSDGKICFPHEIGAFLDYPIDDVKCFIEKDGKEADAKRIFAAATFGLFTNGLDKFDEAYESGLIDGVLTTNLIYQTPELLSRPYYINCDMSKYVALMIDTLNHDGSISDILDPSERIQVCVEEYKKAHGQL